MALDEEFYRVWFEYLIRTPAFKKWEANDEIISKGKCPPRLPGDIYNFWAGYSDYWFGNNYSWEITFNRCFSRLERSFRFRERYEKSGGSFTLAEEIAFEVSSLLELKEEGLTLELTEKGVQEIIRETVDSVMQNRKEREERSSKELPAFRYKAKPPRVNLGATTIGVLKRRLTYYHLEVFLGLSRDEIFFGDFSGPISQALLPFGSGPFKNNPGTRDYFQYWKNTKLRSPPDPRAFLCEEIAEAKKTITAVEAGWFPSVPKM